MLSKFALGNLLICLFCMLIFTGCSKHTNFAVNTGTLGHENDDNTSKFSFNDSSKETNYEMKKLRNGVIVYKDHSRIKDPDVPDSVIHFGPEKSPFQ